MKLITGALNFETLVRPLDDLPQAIAAAVHGTDVGNVTMVWQNATGGYLATMSGADVANSITVQMVPVSSSAWINPATCGITSGFVPGNWVLMITDTDDSNAWGGDPVLIERGYNISGAGALITTVSGLTGVVAMDMSNPSSPTAVSGRGGLINTTLLLPDATLYPAGGILDLNDNDLIVRSGNLTNIGGWLTNGYDGGKWDDESNLAGAEQPAIDSTTALNDPTYLESLGYAKIGTGTGNLNLTTFDGYNVSSGDVVVKFTYYGDANLDGAVDATDLGIATNGYGLTGWSNGDFNYSGSVDGADLTLLDNAYAAAPGSFSATTISSSEIDLAWTNTTPTGTDVSILMSTDGTSYYPYDSVASNQSSYAVTGLDSGTTYHFMAQAYKSSVPSSISSAAYATTTGIPSPEDVTATADSPHQVTVGWDDPAALATTFDVQRSGDGGTTWSTIASGLSANSGSNTYVDTSAYDGTDYLYQVIGHDASSNVSNASATAEAVTPLVTPTSLSATTAVDANLVDATLNWSENSTVSSGVQYEIDRSTDQANWTVLTVTDSGDTSNTYVDAGLLGQADYYYRIQALNSVSDSDYSTTYHLQTQTAAPSMPSNFSTGTVTYNSAALSWTPGTDPGGSVSTYTVQQSADEGQTWANVSTGITATSYTATGLSPSSIYLLQVLAINSAGVSYAAGPIGAKTPAPPQGVPTLSVSANTTDTSYTEWTSAHLSWTYSGFDQPNFEFQYEDTSIGENFHNGLSLATATGNNYGTASGLNAGDSYVFRMRQDFSDGTVSAWSTTSAFVPPVLTAPSASVTETTDSSDNNHLVVGWSGVPSNGFVQIDFTSDAYPDAGWISFDPVPTQDNHYAVDTGAADIAHTGDQGSSLDPGVRNSAGTYTYRVRGFANLNGTYGQPSAWSDPQTGSLGEGASPSLSIGAVTDNSITINWTAYAAAGESVAYTLFTERKVPGIDPTRPSLDGGLGVGGLSASSESSANQSMSYTVLNLDPGIECHFVLETFHADNSIVGFSHITQSTSGAVAPDSPGGLTAAWSQTANSGNGAVAMHWSDDSNNEAGFIVERSVDNVNFTALPNMPLAANENSYVDTTAGPDSAYFYRVKAIGDSSGEYDTPCTGPVRVNTDGVSITLQTQQQDVAFNPKLFIDGTTYNVSTGLVDPPTLSTDPYLVPVKIHVPLGADRFGQGMLTWPSSVRLYDGSLNLVGNLSGGVYTYTWNVSQGLTDQTFLAQANSASSHLGDQLFALNPSLQLYSDAQVAAQPRLDNIYAFPSATQAATNGLKDMPMLTASTEDAANTPGPDLARADQRTIGAFIPQDNVHEDYSVVGGADRSNTPDYQLPSLPGYATSPMPVNDDELMKITLHPVDGWLGGFTLEVPDNVRIWRNQNLTEAVDNSTPPLSSKDNIVLWVQGFKRGSGVIYADWAGPGKSINHADALKVTVFGWWGAEDVPQYGAYNYTADRPGEWTTPDAGTIKPGIPVVGFDDETFAFVQWDAGPQIGNAIFSVNSSYQWERHINIVQVKVSAPPGKNAFEPGASFDQGTHDVQLPNRQGETTIQANSSGNSDAGKYGMVWNAQVTLVGPDNNRGVMHLKAGFVQNVTSYHNVGTYEKPNTTLRAAFSDVPTDAKPILDQSDRNVMAPWYSDNSTGSAASSAQTTFVITESDTPNSDIPEYSDQGLSTAPNRDPLVSWSYTLAFNIFVVAVTDEDKSTDSYTPEAMGSWSFDGSMVRDGGKMVKTANSRDVPPQTSWTAVPPATVVVINGPVANEVGKATSFGP